MRKFVTALTLICMMLMTTTAHANSTKYSRYSQRKGAAAMASSEKSLDFAWPAAVGTIAVLITVATLTATNSTKRSATFANTSN